MPRPSGAAVFGGVHYTDAQRLTIALAELASALGVQLTRNDTINPDWRLVDRMTEHVRAEALRAAEREAKPWIVSLGPELESRIRALEKVAHTPYDFSALVARLEALEKRRDG